MLTIGARKTLGWRSLQRVLLAIRGRARGLATILVHACDQSRVRRLSGHFTGARLVAN